MWPAYCNPASGQCECPAAPSVTFGEPGPERPTFTYQNGYGCVTDCECTSGMQRSTVKSDTQGPSVHNVLAAMLPLTHLSSVVSHLYVYTTDESEIAPIHAPWGMWAVKSHATVHAMHMLQMLQLHGHGYL